MRCQMAVLLDMAIRRVETGELSVSTSSVAGGGSGGEV